MNKFIFIFLLLCSSLVYCDFFRQNELKCGRYKVSGRLTGGILIIHGGFNKTPSKYSLKIPLLITKKTKVLSDALFVTIEGRIERVSKDSNEPPVLIAEKIVDKSFDTKPGISSFTQENCTF